MRDILTAAETNPQAAPWSFSQVDCAIVHVTNACNLRCSYCSTQAGTRGPSHIMPIRTFERVLESLCHESKRDAIALIFHGGEPLLAGLPWFKKAMRLLRKRIATTNTRFKLIVQTNGTLIGDAYARFFADNGFTVGVSLDGPKAIHDSTRGGYDRVLKGLAAMKRCGTNHGLISVLSRPVVNNLPRVLEYFESQGEAHVQFNYLHCSGRAHGNPRPTAEQIFKAQRMILDHMLDFRKHVVIDSNTKRRVLGFAGLRPMTRSSSCHQRICSGGIEFVAVNAAGDIFPCGTGIEERFWLGSTNGKRRQQRGPFFREFFADTSGRSCKTCKAAVICDQGCVALADDDPEYFQDTCKATKKLFAYMHANRSSVVALARRLYAAQQKKATKKIPRAKLLAMRKRIFSAMAQAHESCCSLLVADGRLQAMTGSGAPLLSFGADDF
ncbi:MAG: radical SAM protein [bacterium]